MSEPVSKGQADADTRSAFVAIVGRPSAGKSTLMNALCGQKVAIISPVPQTTRNRIRGILTREKGQLVFVDTPGFHESGRRVNRHMRGLIEETIRDSEELLYVIDASRTPGEEELALMHSVARHADTPRVIAITKLDAAPARNVEQIRVMLTERLPEIPMCGVSALNGDGLDDLVDTLFEHAPFGDPVYPQEFYTDQPPEFRIAEIIREKAIQGLRHELPHALYVEVLDMETRELEGEEEQLWIRAAVFVERTSQRGMIVGKGGSGIKRIRQSAQKAIAALFPYRIHLDLRVKVDPNWRKNDQVLDRLVH